MRGDDKGDNDGGDNDTSLRNEDDSIGDTGGESEPSDDFAVPSEVTASRLLSIFGKKHDGSFIRCLGDAAGAAPAALVV